MADIKYGRKVYRGIDKVTFRDADDPNEVVEFKEAQPELTSVGKDVIFYDYDGSIWATYNKNDFLELSALPSNPTHEGLVAEGWNWTLADAKAYVMAYGMLNISQMYHTSSSKMEYDMDIGEMTDFTAILASGSLKDWGDGIIDSNASHTYIAAGNYTIKSDGQTLFLDSYNDYIQFIRIASGTKYISDVSGSTSLKSVTIPLSVTNIGIGAFAKCASLKYITIPSNITSIGSSAFTNCLSLESITVPLGITSIESGTFTNCTSLKSITIPSSVTSIGNNAFYGCGSLKSIIIPSSVTSIGKQAFSDCFSLKSIIIPSSITSIEQFTFYGCGSLKSVTIPSSVTSIGNAAFSGCISLKSIIIPSSVTSIESSAFGGCWSLESVTIPSSITSIEQFTFGNCTSLKSITIPPSVTSIGNYAFSGCSSLESVTILTTTPPTVSSSSFPSNVKTIYVPHGTLATYQTDTNWSIYTKKLVELSEQGGNL